MNSRFLSRRLLGSAFAAALLASTSSGQAVLVTLVNPGFDENTTKITTGFTGLVNGWSNTGNNYTDSGVEPIAANSQSPTTYAFLRGDNNGAFQLSGATLQEGDVVTLTWFAKGVFDGGQQLVTLVSGVNQVDPFSSLNTLATSPDTTLTGTSNDGPYQAFTLTYTATAVDVGRFVGVAFDNPGGGGSYTFFDTFAIDVTPVPEPGVVALSLVAGGFLLILRRRRRVGALNRA